MDIPFATIEKITKYLRCLKRIRNKKIKFVSSQTLAEHTNVTAEQVRKDLAYFGKFGRTGTGYNIEKLAKKLEKILNPKLNWNVCIIGAGALGHALTNYPDFKKAGFNIIALFDGDPKKIGNKIGTAKIYDVKKFSAIIEKKEIEIAIIATPENAKEEIEQIIAKSKIKGIINFTPLTLDIKSKRKIPIIDVDLSQKMYILSYLITKGKRRQ
ncbi:MAG: redox-sensing transcriptional repressor Rex [Caldisericota bacterium]|nr:redox-sensing transcriptional repressor Rex [Caldisericota bacterium]